MTVFLRFPNSYCSLHSQSSNKGRGCTYRSAHAQSCTKHFAPETKSKVRPKKNLPGPVRALVTALNVVSESGWRCVFESITSRCYLAYSSNERIDIFDTRPMVRYGKRPCTTFSFLVVRVITQKMAYRKAYATSVWGHNSLILARTQL